MLASCFSPTSRRWPGGTTERLDGRGYPRGSKDEELCVETQILTVADVFDALSADRPYRAAMPVAEALAILERDTGTAFDADCVEALKRGLERLASERQPAAIDSTIMHVYGDPA